jgi:hypothetical protein
MTTSLKNKIGHFKTNVYFKVKGFVTKYAILNILCHLSVIFHPKKINGVYSSDISFNFLILCHWQVAQKKFNII